MKYALYLPNFSYYSDLRRTAALAREAEDAGWDGFFVWDDVAGFSGIVDPWILLAAVAMSTTRLRIGALITPLPRRRPWMFARETATLDHLCDGRLVVGVGTGGGDDEWTHFGEETDHKIRGDMLDEALEVVTGLMREAGFTDITVVDKVLDPETVRQPGMPRVFRSFTRLK